MKRENKLFQSLGIDKFHEGGASQYIVDGLNIFDESRVNEFLDEICTQENLIPLQGRWRRLDFQEYCDLLLNGLWHDLAFLSCERMSKSEAETFFEELISRFDKNQCNCYTNWLNNPWKTNAGLSWNSITSNTFDLALIVLDKEKALFTYFIAED